MQDMKIIYLLQSGHYTWPCVSLSFYLDNFLRWQSFSELNLWVWNIIIHFAVLKGFAKILSQSHIIVLSSFQNQQLGLSQPVPLFLLPTNLVLRHVTSPLCMHSSFTLTNLGSYM